MLHPNTSLRIMTPARLRLLLIPALFLTVPISRAAETKPARPNVIFLLTDDQRWDWIGYADDRIHTPNLDRLARAGTIFTNCFTVAPVCALSRASLLTGQYPLRHGIDDFVKTFTPQQEKNLYPVLLRDGGTFTGFIGKWGVGDTPEATAKAAAYFDFWAGQPRQTNYWHEQDCHYVATNGPDNLCDCPNPAAGQAAYDNRFGRADLTDPIHVDGQVVPIKTRQFLDAAPKDQPFNLSISFKAPHNPVADFEPRFAEAYKQTNLPIPATATHAAADTRPDFFDKFLGRIEGKKYLDKKGLLQGNIRAEARLLMSVDSAVGEIMAELEARGLADNTVILFTSDHGYFHGEFGLTGKWLTYDPSIRVPGFLYDPRPGADLPATSDAMILTIDFTTTMLALADVPAPATMQGRNIYDALEAKPDWRTHAFFEHPYAHAGQILPTEAIFDGNWKYIRYVDRNPVYEELFDWTNDPEELTNLATDPAHEQDLARMRNLHETDTKALE